LSALRVLNVDPDGYSPAARGRIEHIAEYVGARLTREELLASIAKFDALIVRFSHVIDVEVIRTGSRLRVIATPATGTDHIDAQAAASRGIRLISLRGETEFLRTIASTAELCWGALLALTRMIPWATEDVRKGHWERDRFVGIDLQGRRLGILGYGRLGRMVARYGLAFGMKVFAFDPVPCAIESGVCLVASTQALFERSDVLSIHVPLTDATIGLVSRELIFQLPPGALLINTSRGSVLNEQALLEALTAGHLAGAALDVLHGELEKGRIASHPLVEYARNHRNLLITPHIGGASRDAWTRVDSFIAERVVEVLEEAK
jgi:D-3-phosphoglycerate dehydrogenase